MKAVLISYNQISGFESGWRETEQGKVFIHACDKGAGMDVGYGKTDQDRAKSVMKRLKFEFYGELEVPIKDVDLFLIYAGLYAMQEAIKLAQRIKQDGGQVKVVACDCDLEEKKQLLEAAEIPLIICECGGEEDMGRLAKEILEGKEV